ncbi:MAG: hypothetical protein BYD32DRAFT_312982 [Podila humilis]|nr:MAG: hypothetical protein BYD32DRAFT_312982 [Podila humilis]
MDDISQEYISWYWYRTSDPIHHVPVATRCRWNSELNDIKNLPLPAVLLIFHIVLSGG